MYTKERQRPLFRFLDSLMELFSSAGESKKNNSSGPIPKEVFEAVRVMGQKPKGAGTRTLPEQKPSPKGASPFLGSDFFSPAQASSVAQEQRASLPNFPPQKASLSSSEEQKKKVIIMFASGGVLLLMIAGLVVWYFLQKDAVDPEVPIQSVSEVTMVVEPAGDPLPSAPFTPDASNFLMIDTETVTAESFLALLNEAGAKISAAQMTKPVEFLLTDKNNNPIAFSRFAYLMGLPLPEELIASLGEPFSIFLYNTGGKVRIGLSFAPFAPADNGTVQELVTKNEASLPFLFRTFLFQGLTVPAKATFRSGVYNTETVRYANIDAGESISFDYVMRDRQWIIGTSKDTLRAIIDKKSQP